MKFFERFFNRQSSYEDQKRASQSSEIKDRLNLATNSKTNKEILYYLAEKDPEERVRLAVTNNKAMPPQVSPILAIDPSQDVRLALAGRLVDLLPDVSRDEQSQLYAFVVQALGTLALDEVLKIRKALASTLKDHAYTPPKVAGQLARDVEREVSEPILRFCAALSDEDLLDILKNHPASWVINAIAARHNVSADVSHAVIETSDRPGGVTLIENQGATLTESLLSYIVEKARAFPEWQKPIAMRSALPSSILKSLAEFVDASVRDLLLARGDFDPETTEEIATIFRRRIDMATDEVEDLTVEQRLEKALREDGISEDLVRDAVGMRDYALAYGALAHLSGIALDKIEAVFDSRSAKSVVAITWKAGLSMRLALQLQQEAARVSHKDLIYPRGGTDYPMDDTALIQQLEILNV
ncbi:MAG: hypothetical protein CL570_04235 [Alphaproteobacteria bacterium]|nr:hypothetical protein [Alphaproteobacteria bacterium]|tara:strand:- start:2736 stop:3974 length:1239 start_codon:yes stop_codon:yes gene_type:complete